MRSQARIILSYIPCLLVLTGCASNAATPPPHLTFEDHLQNPLFAERYWTDMVDRMAMIQIQEDPSLKEKRVADAVNARKLMAISKVKEAEAEVAKGISASFVSVQSDTQGFALLLKGMLYISTDFITDLGPNTHVVLTEAADPRSGTFPDASAFDLGPLQTPYGEQIYVLPAEKDSGKLRTVVLWDVTMKKILGMAQLG